MPVSRGKVSRSTPTTAEVDRGLIADWDEVRAVYVDARDDPWHTCIVPFLPHISRSWLAEEAGVTERTVQAVRNGRPPSATTRAVLGQIAIDFARRVLRDRKADSELKQHAERLCRSPLAQHLEAAGRARSEERRVGKECRSRWSPYH